MGNSQNKEIGEQKDESNELFDKYLIPNDERHHWQIYNNTYSIYTARDKIIDDLKLSEITRKYNIRRIGVSIKNMRRVSPVAYAKLKKLYDEKMAFVCIYSITHRLVTNKIDTDAIELNEPQFYVMVPTIITDQIEKQIIDDQIHYVAQTNAANRLIAQQKEEERQKREAADLEFINNMLNNQLNVKSDNEEENSDNFAHNEEGSI